MNRTIILAILVLVSLSAALYGRNPLIAFQDDAFFYLVIGRNLAEGYGLTFNQVITTNGFHPLNIVVAAPVFFFTQDPLIGMYAVLALQIVLYAFTLSLIAGLLLKKKCRTSLVVFGLIIYSFLAGLSGVYGGEFWLSSALLISCLYVLEKMQAGSGGYGRGITFGLGILMGLAFLSRLDNVFFIGAANLIFLVLTSKQPDDMREKGLKIFLLVAGQLLVVAPYFLYNLWMFNHVMPISGHLKHTFPFFALSSAPFRTTEGLVRVIPAVLLSLVFLLGSGFKQYREKNGFSLALTPLALGTVFHFLFIALFYTAIPRSWYYSNGYLATALFAPVIAQAIINGFSFSKQKLVICIILILSVFAISARFYFRYSIYESLITSRDRGTWAWMEHNLPRGSKIFIDDAPGKYAYFTLNRYFARDGLTLDYEYQEFLKARDINAYLTKYGIQYVVLARTNIQDLTRSHDGNFIFRTCGGDIFLKADALLYKDPMSYSSIWKYGN